MSILTVGAHTSVRMDEIDFTDLQGVCVEGEFDLAAVDIVNHILSIKPDTTLHVGAGSLQFIADVPSLSRLHIVAPEGLKSVETLSALQSLRVLHIVGRSSSVSLQPLSTLGNLESLVLDGLRLQRGDLPHQRLLYLIAIGCDIDVQALENNTSITHLQLTGPVVRDLSFVATMRSLLSIRIYRAEMLTDSALRELGQSATIKSIDAERCRRVKSLQGLRDTNIEQLYLQCSGLTDIEAISSMSSLRRLVLTTGGGSVDFKPILEARSLEAFLVKSRPLKDTLRALRERWPEAICQFGFTKVGDAAAALYPPPDTL